MTGVLIVPACLKYKGVFVISGVIIVEVDIYLLTDYDIQNLTRWYLDNGALLAEHSCIGLFMFPVSYKPLSRQVIRLYFLG